MKKSNDEKYQRRAAIGVGGSLGAAVGAFATAFYSTDSLPVLIGSGIGILLGMLIGTRLKSGAFQYLWIEYPAKIGKQMVLAIVIFFIPFILFLYSVKVELNLFIQYVLLSSSILGGIYFMVALVKVIASLDDLLKKIIAESFSVAFGIAWVLTFSLGLLNQIVKIPSDWLIASTVVLFSGLLGRLIVAWKYR